MQSLSLKQTLLDEFKVGVVKHFDYLDKHLHAITINALDRFLVHQGHDAKATPEANTCEAYCRLIMLMLCDEHGTKIFDNEALPAIRNLDGGFVHAVGDWLAGLAGFSGDAKKN